MKSNCQCTKLCGLLELTLLYVTEYSQKYKFYSVRPDERGCGGLYEVAKSEGGEYSGDFPNSPSVHTMFVCIQVVEFHECFSPLIHAIEYNSCVLVHGKCATEHLSCVKLLLSLSAGGHTHVNVP